jgi:DNA-binding IclR family transcriptional regulator
LNFKDRVRPALERIAHVSGDTVYLHLRSGLETVCVDRVEGSFPIRAVTLEIGGRRPLGFGSAGLAFLAMTDDEEVLEVLDALERELATNVRVTRDSMLQAILAARALGYGIIRDTTVMGVGAVGVAFPERPGLPPLGVGVAMVTERLTPERARALHKLILEDVSGV